MGTKYSANSVSGYNATPPSDDGTVSEANKVKWSTIKSKLTDPHNTIIATVDSDLVTHFDKGPNAYTSNQTLGATHYNQFVQASGSGVTLTLSDANTLGAGWFCDIVNTDTSNNVTLGRATASDMINGVSNNVTIYPASGMRVFVDAAATGFRTFADGPVGSDKTDFGARTQKGDITMSAASIHFAEGANVASASDCNIWSATDGNTVHLTGTTTVTDWGTAPQAGAFMWVICDAATPLTYHATTNDMNTGGKDYTATAGDVLYVYARSTSSYKVTLYRYNQGMGLTVNSKVATTSGSSVSLSTSIPPWVKKITINLYGVSTSGTSIPMLQIGDSGGFEATSYVSNVAQNGPSNASTGTSGTTGILLSNTPSASNVLSGTVTMSLVDAATFLWMFAGVTSFLDAAGYVTHLVGYKATSAVMDRIQITTVGGTDTFDAGSITLIFEG